MAGNDGFGFRGIIEYRFQLLADTITRSGRCWVGNTIGIYIDGIISFIGTYADETINCNEEIFTRTRCYGNVFYCLALLAYQWIRNGLGCCCVRYGDIAGII